MDAWMGGWMQWRSNEIHVEIPSIVPGAEKSFSVWKHKALSCSSAGFLLASQAQFLEGRASDGKPRPRASLRQRCDRGQSGSLVYAGQGAWALPGNDAEQCRQDALGTSGPVRAGRSSAPSFPDWTWPQRVIPKLTTEEWGSSRF